MSTRFDRPSGSIGLLLALVAAMGLVLAGSGCFNTYELERDEFAKLQEPDEVPKVVKSKSGKKVLVDRQTAVYARSEGGRRYRVTPFDFKMTGSQLVASDRDTLLMTRNLDSYEVDLLSTTKTALLISGGVAVAAGFIVGVVVTAGESSFGGGAGGGTGAAPGTTQGATFQF